MMMKGNESHNRHEKGREQKSVRQQAMISQRRMNLPLTFDSFDLIAENLSAPRNAFIFFFSMARPTKVP
jgi:hypothetical protein